MTVPCRMPVPAMVPPGRLRIRRHGLLTSVPAGAFAETVLVNWDVRGTRGVGAVTQP
ncbi:hypothetical protein SANTM175S_09210 [Streptomyces antimycoticus]